MTKGRREQTSITVEQQEALEKAEEIRRSGNGVRFVENGTGGHWERTGRTRERVSDQTAAAVIGRAGEDQEKKERAKKKGRST